MKTLRPAYPRMDTLLRELGGISPDRVLLDPPPGTAVERDVIRLNEEHAGLYELVDGTLVEKAMGAAESYIAGYILHVLTNYSHEHGRLGMVLGADGMIRLFKKLIRLPDVSFTYWDRLPNRKVPTKPILDIAPDLAIEVLSRKNTRAEMARKLKDYLTSGIRVVWYINPRTKRVLIYTSLTDSIELGPDDVIEGGDVLPGFQLPVARLFDDLDDEPSTGPSNGKNRPGQR